MKHGTMGSYTAGFVLSIFLTIVAYVIVVNDYFDGWRLAFILLELASLQLWVQLVFFLHLGKEAKVRWNLTAFLYAALMVLIIGIGSLWIMDNLKYAHTSEDGKRVTPKELDDFIIKDEGY